MAREAERLMADSGWLPELLRTPGFGVEGATAAAVTAESDERASVTEEAPEDAALPAFLGDEAEEAGPSRFRPYSTARTARTTATRGMPSPPSERS